MNIFSVHIILAIEHSLFTNSFFFLIFVAKLALVDTHADRPFLHVMLWTHPPQIIVKNNSSILLWASIINRNMTNLVTMLFFPSIVFNFNHLCLPINSFLHSSCIILERSCALDIYLHNN